MNHTYKVGDRVRMVKDNFLANKGDEGVVINIDFEYLAHIPYRIKCGDNDGWLRESQIEPYPLPHPDIGKRVRIKAEGKIYYGTLLDDDCGCTQIIQHYKVETNNPNQLFFVDSYELAEPEVKGSNWGIGVDVGSEDEPTVCITEMKTGGYFQTGWLTLQHNQTNKVLNNIIKFYKQTSMSVLNKIKDLGLTPEAKLLRKHGIEDECGQPTQTGKELAVLKAYASYREAIIADLKKVEEEEKESK